MSNRGANRETAFSRAPRLQVLLDMDMVLADFEGYFLQKFREKYPEEPFIPLEERDEFYIWQQYEKRKPNVEPKVRSVYCEEGFILNLPEIDGAIEAAKELLNMDGVDVFICSSPLADYKYCLREKYQWVEDHLGPEWVERTILTKDKTLIRGHLLIDDRPYYKGVCDKPSWEHIVFNAPHNLKTDIRGKRRLENWTNGQWREIIEDFKKRI